MKSIFLSKTFWVNLLALCGTVAVGIGYDPSRWTEISMGILAIVNIGLRFVTNTGIGVTQETTE